MDKPEKMDLRSMDVADDKRRQLAQLFPEVVTEIRHEPRMDANGRELGGRYRYAVDFERLKGVLGEFSEILENQRERYGMTWPGKNECLKIIQQPSIATLKPCRKESVNFDVTENLFIEGDNLEALKLLQKSYYGKVKMIYIDPPYNTGKEFIYPDNYSENLDTYLSYTGQVDAQGRKFSTNTEAEGRFHSKWLNMMLPRLYLARNLLRDDGVIFISIGQEEVANLVALCNDIFGEDNSLAIVGRAMKKGGNIGKFFAPNLEFLVVCARDAETARGFKDKMSQDLIDKVYTHTQTTGARKGELYRTMGLYQSSLTLERSRHARYFIECPDGTKCIPPEGKRWRVIESSYREMLDCGDIEFRETKTSPLIDDKGNQSAWNVYTKIWLKDRQEEGQIPVDLITKFENRHSSKEIQSLGIPFDFPKPSNYIKYLAEIMQTEGNDIILDFFSGSCTTAHAVLELNKQDGGNRKFIMVQLPEPCEEQSEAYKAGYKTIADIGKERIRRVIKKLEEEEPRIDANKRESNQEQLFSDPDISVHSRSLAVQSPPGFRVFKLDRSNFRLWDGAQPGEDPDNIAKQLELHEQHIDPNATQEDILYELLLKAGFPLTTKVEPLYLVNGTLQEEPQIDTDKHGSKAKNISVHPCSSVVPSVFSIAEGALLICLQDEITKELIKAMADADPLQVICLDSGFKKNDQLKANAVQTFKARNKSAETATVFRTV